MASDRARFGPSGNSESFYAQGHKHSIEAPKWLRELGLDAFEYSFGRGVSLSSEKAAELGGEARKHGVALSVHAPYYINFANEDAGMREKSRQYLLDSVQAASVMGAERVVFHPGTCTGQDRAEALGRTMKEIEIVLRAMTGMGADYVLICPETMGRPSQLGTLEEVLEICSINPSMLLPTIDFGHINALGKGSLKTKGDYERIVDSIEETLGLRSARRMHVHFSHIEYGKSGEVKHLTLEDEVFGPEFAPLAKVLAERSMRPIIICESKDVMAEDALKLKAEYEKALLRSASV
jgi:deoxyribonuclease IV